MRVDPYKDEKSKGSDEKSVYQKNRIKRPYD